MGYYTRHKLDIFKNNSDLTELKIKDLTVKELKELDVINYALDENLNACDSAKWYNHRDHMKIISEHIRDVVFLLEGEGEENEDIWKEYWLNGKVQFCKAQITFNEYDENKLEEYNES